MAMRQAVLSLASKIFSIEVNEVSVSAFEFQAPSITFCVLGLHFSCSSYVPSEASYRSLLIYLSIPQSYSLDLLFIPLSNVQSTALQLYTYLPHTN